MPMAVPSSTGSSTASTPPGRASTGRPTAFRRERAHDDGAGAWGDVDAAGLVFYPRFFEWYDPGCEALFAALGPARPAAFPEYGAVGLPIVQAGPRVSDP